MPITVFAFSVFLAACANLILFINLPSDMMRWYGFFAQLILIMTALLVLISSRDLPKVKLTGGKLQRLTKNEWIIVIELLLTVIIALWMFITL
ncbi:hypothetical protein WOSG25_100620 [Weissella oryzae SG25]|uniref:Uncharacterized protein n=1 Tax=Weissella oryzae (strain DSM 25784 / JCM 18191 / LMG 30913 / SG25) TaxID=1329250 RepID=A0A069D267_WEIOS|nr:hypothetical protein [Weissella oryzae]GAK31496.1 hypothetical protein WOSG25_100620 [Weissella oryzae SG25]